MFLSFVAGEHPRPVFHKRTDLKLVGIQVLKREERIKSIIDFIQSLVLRSCGYGLHIGIDLVEVKSWYER